MTVRQDSLYPADWRRVARQDWHRIHVMLADGDGEGVGLFLQQALEKYLKAYLLGKGWRLKRVHTLRSLLDEGVEHDSALVRFRDLCERVTGFYTAERYPSLAGSELDADSVRRELSDAQALIRSLFRDEVLE